jgi:hypothetical protein
MKVFLLLAIAALGLCGPASATLLIYKGATTQFSKPNPQRPPKYTTYLIYDPETDRIVRIDVFTENGEKKVVAGSPTALQVSVVAYTNGKTGRALHDAEHLSVNPTTYSDSMTYLRGTNAQIQVNTAGLLQAHPRMWSETRLSAVTLNGDGFITDSRTTYVLINGKTKAANDASQTIEQARATLIDQLEG